MNKWDTMRTAYKEAETTIKAADFMIADMAEMIVGRLKQIDNTYWNGTVLSKLKRELRDFNIQTKRWRR
jgi:hypothetical protein